MHRVAWCARTYCRPCLTLEHGGEINPKHTIEDMERKRKGHLSVLNKEADLADKKICGAREGDREITLRSIPTASIVPGVAGLAEACV